MKRWIPDPKLRRMAHHVYRHSGIDRRHSVLPDFQEEASPLLFHEQPDGSLDEPTTGARNAVFALTYRQIAHDAASRALAGTPDLDPAEVTHLITVTCTGFVNPGPDLYLAEALGLSPQVQRYHLGFMGCYAAFPALRMAEQFCRADPGAVVLVVCIELCTLHLQIHTTEDSLLANALFADGAAAAVVNTRPPAPGQRVLALDTFTTRVLAEGAQDMAWTIGDHGFDMTLSSYIPRLLGDRAAGLVASALHECETPRETIGGWAVHPGGVAILNALQSSLNLPGDALEDARAILRDYGNMSSATILFVLQRMMERAREPEGSLLAAMAFGPGLTVEFGLLKAVGHPAPLPAGTDTASPGVRA
jgi:predicted naringenin-chalcone synthase